MPEMKATMDRHTTGEHKNGGNFILAVFILGSLEVIAVSLLRLKKLEKFHFYYHHSINH
jgi:hypothetical protein